MKKNVFSFNSGKGNYTDTWCGPQIVRRNNAQTGGDNPEAGNTQGYTWGDLRESNELV